MLLHVIGVVKWTGGVHQSTLYKGYWSMLEVRKWEVCWWHHGGCGPHSGLCYIRTMPKRGILLKWYESSLDNSYSLWWACQVLASSKGHPIQQCWCCYCISQPVCVVDLEGCSLEGWYVRRVARGGGVRGVGPPPPPPPPPESVVHFYPLIIN